ncbi:chromosome segregation protein SMC [Halolamina salifodinae]|uniref:Chromosome partition protein Smc n=1 Tax=Halolamina salifodinae TaxID=1202767 RepID=A0A8T4GY08_9EURY|nr:chromosome segregation protein SMC [Halolamina salifodinae]MBP1987889.1 chromosome segregation protein [Halolamina salifodinae]
MHIQELVLDDFKSFGRETHIPFYEDFTVITGPNGSGKSNIIDGVLFALGLARTRGIRAEKLTDLIYNPGDDDTQRAGPREASVMVVLDNSDGTLSRSQVTTAAGTEKVGDVDEITVKRRVKETDDNYYSYYYLNGRSTNLSDIQDLLAQAGITPEGYNVVMQGDVTEIINMTPYQRRGIIDEIAGVAEFDAKKESAREELAVVEERIGEADLRIEEKEDRLEQLADERETALEYQELRDEREEYEGYLRAAELEEKREDLERTEAKIESAEADLAEKQTELDEAEGKLSRLEDELDDLDSEIERTGEDEQLRVKSEIEAVKGEIARLEDRIEANQERIDEAEAERRSAFVDIDRKEEEIEELDDQIRSLKVEKANVKSDIVSKESELAEVEAEIENVDTAFDELKADLQAEKEQLEDLREAKNEKQREKDRLLDEARRRSNRVSDREDELQKVRDSLPDLRARVSNLHSELDKAEKNESTADEMVEELKDRKQELNGDLSEIDEELRELRNEYAELEAKASDTGDTSWPRAVTSIKNAGKRGVHGPVGELASVPREYAEACETAAGGRLANVVVDDDGVGSECIDYLKSRNAGRATFLPMTEMDDRSLPREPNDPGVVGFARELVEYDDRYSGIFSYVLGSTLVVEDMDTAQHLMGQYRMVTLDGDLVEKSGAMTGGSGGGSRYSFSKSGGGRLERLAEEIHDLEDERRSIQNDLDSVETDLTDARERKSAASEKVRSIEADIESAEDDVTEAEERIGDIEDELADLRAEREAVDAQMTELDSEIADLDGEIEATEATIEELEAEMADSKIPELSARADEIQEEIDELEDRSDDLDADLGDRRREKEYAEESLEDLHDTVESAQNKKAELEDDIAEFEAQIEEKEATLEEKHEKVAELEEQLAELKEEREELKAEVREARSERDEQKDAVDRVESRLDSLKRSAVALSEEIADLESQVGEYDADEIPDHDEVEAEIERLTAAMEELEPVNMLAIDEYDEVESDLEELREQRGVLVDERDGIEERIAGFEQRKVETFMDAFEAIDEQFQRIFSRLSDGSGELVLENPEDPFEEGLTMKAEPGDKPVQRLDAMSGGEKSLTALAFIFAIQRHNPAPFYALDEIDAFLDAVNAERVGEMVDDLAGDAQFVVVSHRSALLDRSERAIGVTMQENNVSAVTGIDLAGGETSETEVVTDDD